MNSTYILETAKNIKWESLKDCFGFIDYNVVDILRDIIDDDPNKREVAYWKLDNHIVTQGGLSESCFYILPFLNELVKVTKIEPKFSILFLKYSMEMTLIAMEIS